MSLKTFPFIYFSNAAKQEQYIHAKMNLIKIKVPKLGNLNDTSSRL